MSDGYRSEPIQGMRNTAEQAQRAAAKQKMAQYAVAQEAATEELQEWTDRSAWNPLLLTRNFSTFDRRIREKSKTEETPASTKSEEEESALEMVKEIEPISERYEHANPELQKRKLLSLKSKISADDSADDILAKAQEEFGDPTLADEALSFLLEASDKKTEEEIRLAKEELNKRYEKEIRAGKNIASQAREFSAKGLGTPSALREIYRDLLKNPRDAHILFEEFSNQFPFNKMKNVIAFILKSLGADLKSKGPTISRGELSTIIGEIRNMQAILGSFLFFRNRIKTIESSLQRVGLTLSSAITFEVLAKVFMKFIQERYPSVDKVKRLSDALLLKEHLIAQIIIFSQFRDALRQIAPKFFKDEKQRQDLLLCFLNTLEDLEEQNEKEQEEKEKKQKKKRSHG